MSKLCRHTHFLGYTVDPRLFRGIPYLLRIKTAVENESGSWRSFLLKSFKRGSFSSINLCKKQEGIVF